MQTTVDGFVAGPNGKLDWMAGWDWDNECSLVELRYCDSSRNESFNTST